MRPPPCPQNPYFSVKGQFLQSEVATPDCRKSSQTQLLHPILGRKKLSSSASHSTGTSTCEKLPQMGLTSLTGTMCSAPHKFPLLVGKQRSGSPKNRSSKWPQNGGFRMFMGHFGPTPIFVGFLDFWYPMRRGPMLVFHFNPNINGVKMTYKRSLFFSGSPTIKMCCWSKTRFSSSV